MPTLINVKYKCPFCKTRIDSFKQECSSCGQDVSLLSELHLLPYSLVNQGLKRLSDGDKWGALVKFCAAVEFDKKFERGRNLLTDLAVELGLDELARMFGQNPQAATGKGSQYNATAS